MSPRASPTTHSQICLVGVVDGGSSGGIETTSASNRQWDSNATNIYNSIKSGGNNNYRAIQTTTQLAFDNVDKQSETLDLKT